MSDVEAIFDLDDTLQAIANEIQTLYLANVPQQPAPSGLVRTNALRNSIRVNVVDGQIQVSYLRYGTYVSLGTYTKYQNTFGVNPYVLPPFAGYRPNRNQPPATKGIIPQYWTSLESIADRVLLYLEQTVATNIEKYLATEIDRIQIG